MWHVQKREEVVLRRVHNIAVPEKRVRGRLKMTVEWKIKEDLMCTGLSEEEDTQDRTRWKYISCALTEEQAQ